MNNNETTYTLTYMGRRINSDKLHHFYRVVHPIEVPSKSIVLDSNVGKYPIGTIFEIPCIDDKTFKVGQTEVIGKAEEEDIVRWTNEDKADALKFAARKRFTMVNKTTYDSSLQALSNMYRELSPSQRRAFLFRVLLDIKEL